MSHLFNSITPELPVKDVVKTQQYYRDVLGFTIDWLWENNYGSVSQDNISLFFTQQDNINSVCCYLTTDHVEQLYEEYRKNEAKIIQELASMPWGMKEFIIEDLNGHHLRIGQGEKTIQEINKFTVEP